jgi:LmbE family N-acetylglucosaminyl deacetylase
MIRLNLPAGPLNVVCLGAHPDDIEIGCGGTLLTLSDARQLNVDYVLMTGSPDRHAEARAAAAAFMPQAAITYHLSDLPDGRLPAHWDAVKQGLEDVARVRHADLVLAPRTDDAHQDHRLVAQLVATVWRNSLVLHYEIPKWDGDLGRVTNYVELDERTARRKMELLHQCFPSQVERSWWDDETFGALLRLRGIECQSRYAEGFVVPKAVIALGVQP